MKIRTLALTGAALLALCAAPSYARTSHPSTPEEQAQTEQLNEQALANAQGTTLSMANTDVGTRPAPTVTDTSAGADSSATGSMTSPDKPTPTLPEPQQNTTPPADNTTH